jgi:CheY-like chemotaxis protein
MAEADRPARHHDITHKHAMLGRPERLFPFWRNQPVPEYERLVKPRIRSVSFASSRRRIRGLQVQVRLTTPAWCSFSPSNTMSKGKWHTVLYWSSVEGDGQMSKLRVLLADDHPNLLQMVENIVGPILEVVGKVRDGESLLEAAAKLHPDVVVTDISMPILNGIEAVKKLKESGSLAKVVFLTVHSDQDFVSACFEAGASAYVVKPRIATHLLIAVQAALVGHNFISPDLTYRN